MRFFLRFFLLLIVLAVAGLAMVVWFSLDDQPVVEAGPALSYRDIERARAILKRNDPRGLAAGEERRLTLGEMDLALALDYLMQKYARGGASVALGEDRMQIALSAALPLVPARPYLNVLATVESREGRPELADLRVGSLPVPPLLAKWLAKRLAERLQGSEEYALASGVIQGLELHPGNVTVTYRWQPEALRALGTRLAGADGERLAVYQQHLLTLQTRGVARHGSVIDVLPALFDLAHRRSAAGDAAAENRALLLVLGAWASGNSTRQLVPQAQREPARFALQLQRRRDLAQHFLVSAAIAAGADTGLSDAVGVFKEVSDSRGGSGFSFADLAADRAGTRFGELATGSRAGALRVQRFLRERITEADIMPPTADLPEDMPEGEFKRRFGAVDGPGYQRMTEEIERRIAACRLYRG